MAYIVLNIVLCFIIPWIFGVILYFKDKKIIFVMVPFFTAVAYTVNEFGFHLNFWRLLPLDVSDDLSTLPANLGIYPVLASYLVFCFQRTKVNSYGLILIFTLLTTLLEYLGVIFHAVKYGNGWNVGWTFVSYLIPYLFAFWYYNKLKGFRVL